MALGASVTFGVGSSTGNSFRKDLHDMIATNGRQVDMVGTVKHGDFTENACEGFSGFVIDQLIKKADSATPQFKPNLILIDAGTNNCNRGGTFPDAGKNVSAMITKMYSQSPGVTVILTTILANPDQKQDACRVDINKQYQAIAADLQKQNAKFVLVDMRSSDGPTTNDLADRRHPNDVGYSKMAKVWFQGVQQAQSKGFFTAAAAVSTATNGDSATTVEGSGSTDASASAAAAMSGPMVAASGASSLKLKIGAGLLAAVSFVFSLL